MGRDRNHLDPAPGAPAPTRTSVIVPVPAADRVVGGHRRLLDRAESWGVPAHVTVLYPFVPPARVGERLRDRLATAVRTVAAFDCRFSRTAWFGADVLWLAPEPVRPFLALTDAVRDAFPDYPPYAGAHAEVVPHLTVGERRFGTPAALAAAEHAVRARLPVGQRVDHALLIAGTDAPASWRVLARLPLAEPG